MPKDSYALILNDLSRVVKEITELHKRALKIKSHIIKANDKVKITKLKEQISKG
jgi:hypothetical protein